MILAWKPAKVLLDFDVVDAIGGKLNPLTKLWGFLLILVYFKFIFQEINNLFYIYNRLA
mgnify:CR=1 FL=1